ncbi:MAG: XdhC family protein [Candidatus Hodarchaeales archaeon]
MKKLIEILSESIEKGEPCVLVTVVNVKGSAPQKPGAKMLVSHEGKRLWGTIGGGSIEKQAIKQAKHQLEKHEVLLKEYELLEGSSPKATGMLCGGNMTLFYDIIGIGHKAFIFGAGHISQKLTPLLSSLGFSVTIIDNREFFVEDSFKDIPYANTVTGKLPDVIKDLGIPPKSFVVVMTYSHDLDEKILGFILKEFNEEVKRWKYLGMIGSKRKVKEVFSRLEKEGINKELLDLIHAPIGIPIGSQTPEEIAISIAAEIIKVRNEKD